MVEKTNIHKEDSLSSLPEVKREIFPAHITRLLSLELKEKNDTDRMFSRRVFSCGSSFLPADFSAGIATMQRIPSCQLESFFFRGPENFFRIFRNKTVVASLDPENGFFRRSNISVADRQTGRRADIIPEPGTGNLNLYIFDTFRHEYRIIIIQRGDILDPPAAGKSQFFCVPARSQHQVILGRASVTSGSRAAAHMVWSPP